MSTDGEPQQGEDSLVCVVEIPKGTRNKYEYDPELGGIKFDVWRTREEAVAEIEASRERLARA